MKQIKKIEAFTLTEMIVVLILTSIVVGLAFTILSLVQKQMLGIQSNFQANTELRLFEQSLWLDFNRYHEITYDDIETTLEFRSEIDSVSYKFQDKMVIKDRDTFDIPLKTKSFYFDGNSIEKGYLDAIKLETTKTLQNKQLFIFKRNGANAFMN